MGQDASQTSYGQNPLLRVLVLSPLCLSLAAAALLAALAPTTWGVADEVGMDPWVPVFSSLILALPVLAMDLYAILLVWKRMNGRFEVDLFGGITGGAAHWLAAVCLVIFAGTMGSAESYETLGADGTTSGGFVFLVTIAAAMGLFLLGGLTAVYVWAITPGATAPRALRSEDEPDFIRDWVRRR